MEFLTLGFLQWDILPYMIVSLLIAFSVHEFSHAYVAYKFGDPTAKNQGRLTLNPIVHLDPLGTILILIAGFGWARPVPVNRFLMRKPRLGGILVSLAGPFSNLLLAFIGVGLSVLLSVLGVSGATATIIGEFLYYFSLLNCILFVFNLLPLPPLDGYRIIQDLVSNDVRAKMSQYEVYGSIIFLVIVVVTPIYNVTLGPLINVGAPTILYGIIDFFRALIG